MWFHPTVFQINNRSILINIIYYNNDLNRYNNLKTFIKSITYILSWGGFSWYTYTIYLIPYTYTCCYVTIKVWITVILQTDESSIYDFIWTLNYILNITLLKFEKSVNESCKIFSLQMYLNCYWISHFNSAVTIMLNIC